LLFAETWLRTHHGTIYPQLVVNDEAQCKAGLGLCIPYYVVLKKDTDAQQCLSAKRLLLHRATHAVGFYCYIPSGHLT